MPTPAGSPSEFPNPTGLTGKKTMGYRRISFPVRFAPARASSPPHFPWRLVPCSLLLPAPSPFLLRTAAARTPSPQPRPPKQRAQQESLASLPAQPCRPQARPAHERSLPAAQIFLRPVPMHLPPFFATESLRIPPSASSKSSHPRRRASLFPRAARKTPASLLPLLRIPRPRSHRANPAPAPDSPVADSQDLLPSPSGSPAGFRMPRVATRHQSLQAREGLQLPPQNFHSLLPQLALRAEPRELVRVGQVQTTNPFPSGAAVPELWRRCSPHEQFLLALMPTSPSKSG